MHRTDAHRCLTQPRTTQPRTCCLTQRTPHAAAHRCFTQREHRTDAQPLLDATAHRTDAHLLLNATAHRTDAHRCLVQLRTALTRTHYLTQPHTAPDAALSELIRAYQNLSEFI